jgi:hypothetical protein
MAMSTEQGDRKECGKLSQVEKLPTDTLYAPLLQQPPENLSVSSKKGNTMIQRFWRSGISVACCAAVLIVVSSFSRTYPYAHAVKQTTQHQEVAGPWLLKPGQVKSNIPTWIWPIRTQVSVTNESQQPAQIQLQTGSSPVQEYQVQAGTTFTIKQSFGAAPLTIENRSKVPLKTWIK